MEETLHQLGRILLNAVPTFLLIVFLILFLRGMFFGPLAKILKRRYEDTEGAEKAADESLRRVEVRLAEYQEQLRRARGEIYAEQAAHVQKLENENAARIEAARRDAEAEVARASERLQAEYVEARRQLQERGSELADRIVNRILEGRAA